MMSFCKKTVHSILSLSQSTADYPSHYHHACGHIRSTSGSFGLITREIQEPPNRLILESAAIKPTSTSTSTSTFTSPACKKHSTTFQLLDNVSNGSCTESLGFESSDYPMEEEKEELWKSRSTARSRWKTAVAKVRTHETNFPPPLPSLNQNGKPCFYLKPLRRNGRLELTEVRIERREIFMANREDGRLRLQFIRSEPQHPPPPYQDLDQLEEQEPFPLSSSPPPPPQEEEKEEIIENQEEEEEDEEISEEEGGGKEEDEEREEGRRLREWNLERIRWRCQEVNNHRPHHHLLYGATIV